jgi:hypothetical protein
MPQLIFHLGDFKTGSTALQGWLAERGAAEGIFFPATNNAPVAQALAAPGAVKARFSALAAELRQTDLPFAVVSAEHFEFADPARLLAATETHLPEYAADLRLVAYVRPHAEALLARYGESVKIGNFTGDLDAYFLWPATLWRLACAPRFGRWRSAFGARFSLRLYRRADFPGGDVIRDFAGFVTGRDPGPQPAPATVNPTPGLRDLALLRALHLAVGPLEPGSPMEAARWTFGRALGRAMAARGAPDAPLVLHRALAEQLARRFARDAAATDAAFFTGTPLTGALAAAPAAAAPAPAQLDPAAHLDPGAQEVVALWAALLRQGLASAAGARAIEALYHETSAL